MGAEDSNKKLKRKKNTMKKREDDPEMGISQPAHKDSRPVDHIVNSGEINNAGRRRNSKTGEKNGAEDAEDEVYQMSSGDEDYSEGMKKWIAEYYQSRPGLKVLQKRIDDFIIAHEAKEERARAEREAQAAEGGWTVVVQQKGRKKTADAQSGIAICSVAQAAVLDKMGKRKKKEVGLDFYRFQKGKPVETVMMLQSKFEQDKKRIQQMSAARKFRPY